MKTVWLTLSVLCWTAGSALAANPDDLLGKWLNEEGTAKIEIYKQDDRFYGKIIWLRDPVYAQKDVDEADGHPLVKVGATKVDYHNPDESLQSKPVLGLVILRAFAFAADDDEWSGGRIYDPKNGKDYKAYIQLLEADKLKLRGYIGFSLIGRTTYWTRVKE